MPPLQLEGRFKKKYDRVLPKLHANNSLPVLSSLPYEFDMLSRMNWTHTSVSSSCKKLPEILPQIQMQIFSTRSDIGVILKYVHFMHGCGLQLKLNIEMKIPEMQIEWTDVTRAAV